jgi:hypothetical protein
MSNRNDPIEYERVERDVPAAFPWIAVIKLVITVVAIPVIVCFFWLLVLIGYWFKYGRWAGWNAPLGD